MGHSANVKKEFHFIFERFAAHVAMEWILIPVKAHVDRIHDAVTETHVAMSAFERLLAPFLALRLRRGGTRRPRRRRRCFLSRRHRRRRLTGRRRP